MSKQGRQFEEAKVLDKFLISQISGAKTDSLIS